MERKIEQVKFQDRKAMKRQKVAAYARVSSGKDAMLHSLSAQISYYSGMIQRNPRWEYCGVYADEDLTGTKSERENVRRLIEDCKAVKIDIVITKSISRFARNTVTLLETIRELRDLGVAVIFEEQNIDTLTAEGELLLTLLAAFAQAESLSASENMKWRYRKGFEKGEVMGVRRLFGYEIEKGVFTIDEERAQIIRDIFDRFNAGESMESIARSLRESGVTGIHGGTILEPSVRSFLAQEKYTGNALMQKWYVNNHLEKKVKANRGELPQYYAEGTHDAIIDMETFAKAQERLQEIKKSYEGRAPQQRTVFTGRIICAKCGATFIRAWNKKRVWQCVTYKRKGRDVCDARQIPDDILREITCEVLGISELDDDAFNARVDHITADTDEESNILTYHMTDGEAIVKRWKNSSRSRSWTKEMKEAAKESGRKGGFKRWQEKM